MTKTFEKADNETKRLLVEMMRRFHPEITDAGVTIDVLFANNFDEDANENLPALKLHGYGAAAIIKIVPLQQRALGHGDALLTIDGYSWGRFNAPERLALLDHELEHIELVLGDGGEVKLDDMKRPRIRLKLHDWNLQGFDAIAKRHGEDALEVQAVRACRDKSGQMRWDFTLIDAILERTEKASAQ